jgi:hypothetical protein
MAAITKPSFLASWNEVSWSVLLLFITAGVLLGCGGTGGSGSRPVHFVEVSNPAQVASRYGEDGLEDLLSGLVRPEETTYVIVANHAEGQVIRFPADMWLWNRWGRLDALRKQIRKAASASTTTDDYQEKLHELSKKVYGETERPVLVRNTALGGWSGLKKCAGAEPLGQSEDEEVQLPEPNLGTPASWGTILGAWLWRFGLLFGFYLLGKGWRFLGRKARDQDD